MEYVNELKKIRTILRDCTSDLNDKESVELDFSDVCLLEKCLTDVINTADGIDYFRAMRAKPYISPKLKSRNAQMLLDHILHEMEDNKDCVFGCGVGIRETEESMFWFDEYTNCVVRVLKKYFDLQKKDNND